jgi:type III secretion protein V
LPLPVVRLRPGVAGLAPTAFVIRLNEVPLGRGDLPRETWDEAGARLGEQVLALARRYGHELFGLEETQALLDALERTHPALVREVVPKLISPVLLTDVLRRLVEEGISLRNLRDILGALAEWAPQERDPVALTEHVRVALRRAITYRHAGDGGVLAAYLLDPMIEDAIRDAVQKTATGSYLALEPQISRDIIQAVGRALGPDGSNGAVLLTGVEIRRYVRRLVELEHPGLAVLSFQELAPEAQIRPIARISVG